MVAFLYNGLNDLVYSSEERNVISHVRTLTDLKSVISKVAKFWCCSDLLTELEKIPGSWQVL